MQRKLVALVDDLLLAVDADKADGAEAGVDGLDRNESTRPIGARGPIFARIVCTKIFSGKLVIVTFLQCILPDFVRRTLESITQLFLTALSGGPTGDVKKQRQLRLAN